MNAFIFMCQVGVNQINIQPHIILSSPSHNLTLIFLTLFGIWNLDFFRYITPPFCVSTKLSGLQVASLEYIVGFYPLVLIIVTYYCVELHDKGYRVFVWLAKPFRTCTSCLRDSWNPKASLIHAFAAFLLLAYSKFLVVSYSLLTSNVLNTVSGPLVVYYDSSIPYFSTEHLPFAILAITVLLFCVALPMLVLLLYPTKTFQKCLGCCSIRWHALHAFVDVFQGCYKNGTAGTPDYRCFAGLYLLWRILFYISQVLSVNHMWLFKILVPSTAALLFLLMRPYKDNRFNILDSLIMSLLSFSEFWAMYVTFVCDVSYAVVYILPATAIMYISLYSAYRVLSWAGVLRRYSCKWVDNLLSSTMEYVSAQRPDQNDGNNNEVPDRINNPELYEPLLPATSGGKQSGGEDIDTYPQCGNSYGSV